MEHLRWTTWPASHCGLSDVFIFFNIRKVAERWWSISVQMFKPPPHLLNGQFSSFLTISIQLQPLKNTTALPAPLDWEVPPNKRVTKCNFWHRRTTESNLSRCSDNGFPSLLPPPCRHTLSPPDVNTSPAATAITARRQRGKLQCYIVFLGVFLLLLLSLLSSLHWRAGTAIPSNCSLQCR